MTFDLQEHGNMPNVICIFFFFLKTSQHCSLAMDYISYTEEDAC